MGLARDTYGLPKSPVGRIGATPSIRRFVTWSLIRAACDSNPSNVGFYVCGKGTASMPLG